MIIYSVEAMKESLVEGTERVVFIMRTALVVLFILVQFIPFSLIGWAAWRDLKVTV
jgi:hypothetical protein